VYRNFRLLAYSAALAFLLCSQLSAQSIYGGLRGIVTDKSGASVADASVTLTNEGTNATRATQTTSGGEYVFSQLVPATYTVVVETKGFKKFERKNIIVNTQNDVTIDVGLEVGNVTESVLVTEEVPLLETSTASMGQVIDRQKIADLPILGRNPYLFARFANNVAPVGHPGYVRMQDQSGSSQISIAGGPVRGNNYLLDGVPITDLNNRAVIVASLESVQEMKVQSNTYDADIGRSGGGMFNTLLKSGTNDYHGVLGGYIRQTDWLANLYFARGAGQPIVDQPFRNYYGSFGGPVRVPKVYDGRNKTFFFIVFEGYRDTQGASGQTAVPTLKERAGDFSASSVTIYNPTIFVNGQRTTPFAGNIIPQNMLNLAGLGVAATFAQPNISGASGFGVTNTNWQGTLPSKADQKTAKIDERFKEWWSASLSFLKYNSLEPGETWFANLVSTPAQWRLDRRVDATQINNTISINPTTVLTARYGYNRFPNYGFTKFSNVDFTSLGFSPTFNSQRPTKTFPDITFQSGFYTMGAGGISQYVPNSHNFNATLSKYIGKHTLKFGSDYRNMNTTGIDNGNAAFGFTNQFTRKITLDAKGNEVYSGGADIADLLLGMPDSASVLRSTKLSEFIRYYSAFAQDDIRLRSNLTINVGMRWEHESGLQETNDRLITGFDPNATNSYSGVVGTTVRGAVTIPGINAAKNTTGNPTNAKLSPRLGVAWQMNPKTTVRGGFGIFWAPTIALNPPYNSEGYAATTSPLATSDGGHTALINFANPFPNGLTAPVGNAKGDQTGLGLTLNVFDRNAKSTWIEQFSFDVQREVGFGTAIGIAYVGSRSHHLVLGTPSLNMNQLLPQYASLGAVALNASVTNPYYTAGGPGLLGSATISKAQSLRPFPAFSDINLLYSDQNKARYDSLALRGQKRLSAGLTFLAAFTMAKGYDESSGGAGNDANGNTAGPQNYYNLPAEYSLSNFIAPYRFSLVTTYELPFGKGKKFLGNANKLTDLAVGGWSINMTNITQTGYFLNIKNNDNQNGPLFSASQRPNAAGGNAATSGSVGDRINGVWLNSAAFSAPGSLSFGNVSRTIPVLGPGLYNWDASAFKTFNITERFKAQFRGEILNATNTPYFRAPDTNFGAGTFGKVTSQGNFNRMIQLGVRVSF